MKFCSIMLILVLMLSTLNHLTDSASSKLKLSDDIFQSTDYSTKVSKIIFSKVKRHNVLTENNEKYAKELSYFFSKTGFKRVPVSYLLFENGDTFELNPEWQTNSFKNNLNLGVLFVLFSYENDFNSEKYDTAINNLKSELKDKVTTTNIQSSEDIKINEFKINNSSVIPQIDFKETDQPNFVKDKLADLDFKTKKVANIEISDITVPGILTPNEIVKVTFTIKNNSEFDSLFTSTNSLKLVFKNNTNLYVNGKWSSVKTPIVINNDFLKPNSAKTYSFDIKVPLLFGETSEEYSLFEGDREIMTKKLTYNVKNIGQKIVKVKTNIGSDYQIIQQDPKYNSIEIGRAAKGEIFEFIQLKDNYYQVKFNDNKTGWLNAKYVELPTE